MNFFARKQQNEKLDVTFEEQLAEQQVAPGTQLHYDSRLIQRLRGHAVTLLDQLERTGSAAQGSKFEEAAKSLHQFRLLLNEHLLDKNLRLYTYLSCCLKGERENLELMREMRRETTEISRRAMRFVTHYNEIGIQEETRTDFLEELAQLCDVLKHRFAREERSLYAMYRPPQLYPALANPALGAGSLARAELAHATPC